MSASVTNLPPELLFRVCVFSSAEDIVHLLSTCRTLGALLSNESLWFELCGRYGLRDVSCFPLQSFRLAYVGVLHVYGPVLGLWANDSPYKGNILEFRFSEADDRGQAGIVGEVWRFQHNPDDWAPDTFRPEVIRVRAVEIYFDVKGRTNVSEALRYGTTRVRCVCESDHGHEAVMDVVEPYGQDYCIIGWVFDSEMAYRHPKFPDASAPWLDTRAALPRLPPRPTLTWKSAHQEGGLRVQESIATSHLATALSFQCSDAGCKNHHRPNVRFTIHEAHHPRYYPLRSDIQRGAATTSSDWHPRTLEGLWIGDYGPHGPEVLWVVVGAGGKTVKGYKITGDENMPRGTESWAIYLEHSMPQVLMHELGLAQYACFGAILHLSGHGYTSDQGATRTLAALDGEDEIRIFQGVRSHSVFRRYKGRLP